MRRALRQDNKRLAAGGAHLFRLPRWNGGRSADAGSETPTAADGPASPDNVMPIPAAQDAGAGSDAPVLVPAPVEASTPAAPDTLPRNLSPWGMFVSADWVVRSVMIGLALASVITWTIWLVKAFEIAASRRRASADLRAIRAAMRHARSRCVVEGAAGVGSARRGRFAGAGALAGSCRRRPDRRRKGADRRPFAACRGGGG